MKHNLQVQSGNILICPMTSDDSEQYRRIRNQNENRKWFVDSKTISSEVQRTWFNGYLEKSDEYMFSIYSSGILVGGCSLYCVDKRIRSAEFGRIAIDTNQQGKGYGYEATLGTLKISKDMLGLESVRLFVKKDNTVAIKTYLKAGFAFLDYTNKDTLLMIKKLV